MDRSLCPACLQDNSSEHGAPCVAESACALIVCNVKPILEHPGSQQVANPAKTSNFSKALKLSPISHDASPQRTLTRLNRPVTDNDGHGYNSSLSFLFFSSLVFRHYAKVITSTFQARSPNPTPASLSLPVVSLLT